MGRVKYYGTDGDESYSQSLTSLYPPDDTNRCYTWMNGMSPHLSAARLHTPYILCRLDAL